MVTKRGTVRITQIDIRCISTFVYLYTFTGIFHCCAPAAGYKENARTRRRKYNVILYARLIFIELARNGTYDAYSLIHGSCTRQYYST